MGYSAIIGIQTSSKYLLVSILISSLTHSYLETLKISKYLGIFKLSFVTDLWLNFTDRYHALNDFITCFLDQNMFNLGKYSMCTSKG